MYVRANHCHKGNRLPQDGLAWTSGGDAQQAAHEVEDIVGLLAPELLQVTLAISLRRVVLCEHRALELDLSQHARDGVEHNWVDASREDGPTAAVSKTQLAGMCMLVNELDSGLEDVEILLDRNSNECLNGQAELRMRARAWHAYVRASASGLQLS